MPAQYQPCAIQYDQAPHIVPYRPLMYPSPHLIWVAGLVFQSDPADSILDPGSACGIPYAPLLLLLYGFQPLRLWLRRRVLFELRRRCQKLKQAVE